MANPSKAKGTRAETKVARYLSDHGLMTERKALAGSKDRGDLRMLRPDGTEVTLEVKAGRQTERLTRSMMMRWKAQTLAESKASGTKGALVILRYHRSFIDSEVWLPNSQWGGLQIGWTVMHINDFIRQMGG